MARLPKPNLKIKVKLAYMGFALCAAIVSAGSHGGVLTILPKASARRAGQSELVLIRWKEMRHIGNYRIRVLDVSPKYGKSPRVAKIVFSKVNRVLLQREKFPMQVRVAAVRAAGKTFEPVSGLGWEDYKEVVAEGRRDDASPQIAAPLPTVLPTLASAPTPASPPTPILVPSPSATLTVGAIPSATSTPAPTKMEALNSPAGSITSADGLTSITPAQRPPSVLWGSLSFLLGQVNVHSHRSGFALDVANSCYGVAGAMHRDAVMDMEFIDFDICHFQDEITVASPGNNQSPSSLQSWFPHFEMGIGGNIAAVLKWSERMFFGPFVSLSYEQTPRLTTDFSGAPGAPADFASQDAIAGNGGILWNWPLTQQTGVTVAASTGSYIYGSDGDRLRVVGDLSSQLAETVTLDLGFLARDLRQRVCDSDGSVCDKQGKVETAYQIRNLTFGLRWEW